MSTLMEGGEYPWSPSRVLPLENEMMYYKFYILGTFFFMLLFFIYFLLFVLILGCFLQLGLFHQVCKIIYYYSFIMSNFFIRVKLVRLGHPARLLPQVLDSALDAQVHNHDFFFPSFFISLHNNISRMSKLQIYQCYVHILC